MGPEAVGTDCDTQSTGHADRGGKHDGRKGPIGQDRVQGVEEGGVQDDEEQDILPDDGDRVHGCTGSDAG